MENSWEPVKTHDRWSIDGSFLERVIILELSPMAPENTKRSPWRPTSWCRACRRSWKVRPKVCRFSLGKFMGKSWETDFTRGWTGAANIFGKWYAFRSHTGRKARWSRVKGLKTDRQQPTSPWQFSQFGTLWWRWNPLWLGYTPPFYTLFFFELATIWCDLMVPRDNWQILVKWLLVEAETPACRGRIYRAATWNHHFAPHLSAEMGGTHWLSTQIRNSRNSRLVDGFKHFFGPTAPQPQQG